MAGKSFVTQVPPSLPDVPVVPLPPGLGEEASRTEDLEEVITPLTAAGDDPRNKSTLIGTRTKYVLIYSPVGDIRRKIFRSSKVNKLNLVVDYLGKIYSEGPNRGRRVFYTTEELTHFFPGHTLEETASGFDCPIETCPKSLGSFEKLRIHLRYFHTNEYEAIYKEEMEAVMKEAARRKMRGWLDKMGLYADPSDNLDLNPAPTRGKGKQEVT